LRCPRWVKPNSPQKYVVFALQKPSSARGASWQLVETARTEDNSKKLNDVVNARRFAFSNKEAREGFGQGTTRMAESHGTVCLLIQIHHSLPSFPLHFHFPFFISESPSGFFSSTPLFLQNPTFLLSKSY